MGSRSRSRWKLGVSRTLRRAGKELSGAPLSQPLLQVVPQRDRLAGTALSGRGGETFPKLGIDFLQHVVEIRNRKKHGSRPAALGNDRTRPVLGCLFEKRAQLGTRDVSGTRPPMRSPGRSFGRR